MSYKVFIMSKKKIILLLILLFKFSHFAQAQETITLNTYYPSPYGVYNELRAIKVAIGDNYYDQSQYCWAGTCGTTIDADADLVVEGKVAIGTEDPLNSTLAIFSPASPMLMIRTFTVGLPRTATLSLAGWQGVADEVINEIVFRTMNGGGATVAKILNKLGTGIEDGYLQFQTKGGPALPHTLKTHMTIDQDGNVGIGTTTPNYQLELSTDSAAKPTSGAWTIVSDKRLKKDIEPFNDGLNVLMKINPVKYRLNGKAGTPKDKEGISVIAQKMKDIAPYTVNSYKAKLNSTDKEETELLNFDSSPLTFVIINAVKEQQKQITLIKAEIEMLKSQIKIKP